MIIWRLSKYNIQNYDEAGRYLEDEWTDVSDVGRRFGGQILTREEYLNVEDSYVSFLRFAMKLSGVEKIQIVRDNEEEEFELSDKSLAFGINSKDFGGLTHGRWIGPETAEVFSRLALRGLIGFALTDRKSFFAWFRWDLNVHFGASDATITESAAAKPFGLFLTRIGHYDETNELFSDYAELMG